MTKTSLHEMTAAGESSFVEFARDVIDDGRLAKGLVAFANLDGGQVLLGVDDDGNVRGLTRCDPPARDGGDDAGRRTYRRLEEWVAQACRDKIRPEIVPRFEVVPDVAPGRDVAVPVMNGIQDRANRRGITRLCHFTPLPGLPAGTPGTRRVNGGDGAGSGAAGGHGSGDGWRDP